jgi:hypothetical protein
MKGRRKSDMPSRNGRTDPAISRRLAMGSSGLAVFGLLFISLRQEAVLVLNGLLD